ncbi:hypothetical protein J6G99_02860 [bacterium]|nr:hypothetical protein [bacterium]
MVSQVGLNTNYSNNNLQNKGLTNPLAPVANDYSNDFMMPQALLNFQAQPQSTIQSENQENQNNKKIGDMSDPEYLNYVKSQYPDVSFTEKGNPYMKTSFTKKSGALIGFLAPIATGLYKIAKGTKVSDIFKFKELAVKCPVLAGIGFAIGVALDGIINNLRAKEADNVQKV